MKIDTNEEQVILFAKRLVKLREPSQGYGDVGNTLIDFLREEISAAVAKDILSYLEDVYADDRAKTSKTAELAKVAREARKNEYVEQWTR